MRCRPARRDRRQACRVPRPIQQVAKAQLTRPVAEVSTIKRRPLHLEDAQHVRPLAVVPTAAITIPLQLGQDRVFCGGDRLSKPSPRAGSPRSARCSSVRRGRAEDLGCQTGTQMNVGESARRLGLAGVRMAGPKPGHAESTHRRAHAVRELKSPPRRRPPQQFDQHPSSVGTGIG
jgi:hypothetical protein